MKPKQIKITKSKVIGCIKCGIKREVLIVYTKNGKPMRENRTLFCKSCATRYANLGRSLIDAYVHEQLSYYNPSGPYILKCDCGTEQTYTTKDSLCRVLQTTGKCGKCSSALKRTGWLGLKVPMTDEYRKKLRIAQLNLISKRHFNGGQVMPGYNISSIPILEEKAKELNITDLQHAENGGEYFVKKLGYYVDGYSEEKNIVIEYYEKAHNRQVERDERRQKEIMGHLNLSEEQFIIIRE